jgi:hypothetical protein
MLSYQTALETLGFQYQNELENMQNELSLVEDGIFGILGSPFQQTATTGVQPTQKAPTGTPSSGRPKGQTNTKTKNTNPSQQPGSKTTKPKKTASLDNIKKMTKLECDAFLAGAKEVLTGEEYIEFVEQVLKERLNEQP